MKLFRRTNPKSKFYYLVVVILFTLPVGLLIVGAISLTEANHRSSMISIYNKRAKMWNKHGLEDFKNLTFELVKDGEGYLMEENTTKTGEFFPVRDSCKLEGDPAEGCIETDSFYYSREVYTTDEPIKIQIYHEGRLLINDTLLPTTQRTLNVRQMNCNHNTKDCIRECGTYNGTWDSKKENCVYLEYLQSACYRLSLTVDNEPILDSPPEWDLDTDGIGCFHADNWSPFNFGMVNLTTIPVEVRYYQDSTIAASYATSGCSDTKLTDAQCMGLTLKEASRVGIAFSLLGLGILVFLIIMMMIVNYCRRVISDADEFTPLPDVYACLFENQCIM